MAHFDHHSTHSYTNRIPKLNLIIKRCIMVSGVNRQWRKGLKRISQTQSHEDGTSKVIFILSLFFSFICLSIWKGASSQVLCEASASAELVILLSSASFFFSFFGFTKQSFSVWPWLSWNSLCKPNCPHTQRFACLWHLSAVIKGTWNYCPSTLTLCACVFMGLCVCLCKCMHTWIWYPNMTEKDIWSLRARVIASCELPKVGAGIWTEILMIK